LSLLFSSVNAFFILPKFEKLKTMKEASTAEKFELTKLANKLFILMRWNDNNCMMKFAENVWCEQLRFEGKKNCKRLEVIKV
jgi:hypothetical protein